MPYIKQPPHHHRPSKASKAPDHEICMRCGMIYHQRRWQADPQTAKQWKMSKDITQTVCPVCRKLISGFSEGVVMIDRGIFGINAKEMENEIRNIARSEFDRDPLKQIVSITQTNKTIIVNVTRKELAATIGKRLQRSRKKSKLDIHFSPHEDFMQVFLTTKENS